ncbi:MAG: glycerophosphodiester phosphodiesterase [Candidatus Saccharimonadales bacterium]
MKIIGHRGARGLAPENTLKAFEKALEHHVDEIELDVRVTKDGKTVIIHNPFLKDPAGNKLEINKTTFEELQKHKPDLASLEESIAFVNRRVPMLIEIKPRVPTKQAVAVLRDFLGKGWRPEDFLLASFSQKILRELHRELPEIQKVVIERWSGVKASYRARQVGTKRLNMRSWWLWSGFLRSMQRGGYQIAPYTMNNPAKVRKWQRYLYGVITDYPDRFE